MFANEEGFMIFAQDGRGAYFYKDGKFRGFVRKNHE